jgi:predicted exporter
LTATTVLGIFGMGWLIVPDLLGRFWGIAPGENLNYIGHRYGALLIGLAATVWLGRNALNTQARRALMVGAFVSLALTSALSLYGALALGLNAWSPFAIELALSVGLAWVLFIKPEPVV